ncbi:hypothetical protein P280DRAFT_531183 [Massarina eburnea CBS 473.64]|uniref:Uncharacterized protein n=1 Tax=Massarina eburnea CBS 473.64 TaxID=1395130 RepID=A0A6A6SBG9_9PLEO|nr:hypothetical protein P280DRAFT_531183 [Massarina eburnea CBS 473.64]
MEIEDLILSVHENVFTTESIAAEMIKHAAILGSDIASNFATLQSIFRHHEALLRSRWIAKTPAKRVKILRKAWPDISEFHRPDIRALMIAGHLNTHKLPQGPILWPQINLEDLKQAETLLIFMEARARNAPWTFVLSESKFSPLSFPPQCFDCKSGKIHMAIRFDKDPFVGTYSAAVKICEEEASKSTIRVEDDFLDLCPRPGIITLRIQQRILQFLVACAREILHDMEDGELINGPTRKIKPAAIAVPDQNVIRMSFADTTLLAPYRSRSTIDFERLQSYLAALLNNAKDHLWALREDPAYMADIIKDHDMHSTERILDSKGRMHPIVNTDRYINAILNGIMHGAYSMVALWDRMHHTADRMSKLSKDGIAHELPQHFHDVMAFRHLTVSALHYLARKIQCASRGAPNMRHWYYRTDGKLKNGMNIRFRKRLSHDYEDMLAHQFQHFQDCIDNVDEGFLQTKMDDLNAAMEDSAGRGLISPLLSELISQFSIVVECLRQITLWLNTPMLHLFTKEHDEDCSGCAQDKEWAAFTAWINAVSDCNLSTNSSITQMLRYHSFDKTRNRESVEKTVYAEQILDRIWGEIDDQFKEKTGKAQHPIVARHMSRQMRRTVPWDTREETHDQSESTWAPLSRALHDESKQITGPMLKLSVSEKKKEKSRGTSDNTLLANQELPNIPMFAPEDEHSPQIFTLDKNSYKVFKTLFGIRKSESDELPKFIKWNNFKRAMTKVRFSVEKMQGSAWQFSPTDNVEVERSIQFHEPHPNSDIPYTMARRFGRRLERVYGWSKDTFQLA